MISLGRAKTLTVIDDVRKESSKTVSRFQLAVIAGLRSRQLFNGARPRIVGDRLKRKNTGIALEEVRLGLIAFSMIVAARGKKPGG
jgi:DNA-directed RNA polymerase omega subunit